ncbi:MAG: hypothetical protein ACFFDW_15395 [Candidatus Thorarchaeota archaeon]
MSDVYISILEILQQDDLSEELESSIESIINLALEHIDNMIIRSTAADAIILAQASFGNEWNFEKTVNYGNLLRGLLPPEETKGILAGILINGLANEIDLFGDMSEFSELRKSLNLMRSVFTQNKECINDIFSNYIVGLVNAMKWFGEAEQFPEMYEILEELDELSEIVDCPLEVKTTLANGFSIALDLSGFFQDLDMVTNYSKKLFSLAKELSEDIEIQKLAVSSTLKAANWASIHWDMNAINSLLSNIKKIIVRNKNEIDIQIEYAKGLFSLTQEISQIGKEKILDLILKEITAIYQQIPDSTEIAQYYSRALVNMTFLLSDISDSFHRMDTLVEKLYQLKDKFPKNKEISINYSKSLVNQIHLYGKFGKIQEMEDVLEILKLYLFSTENYDIMIRLGKAYIDAILAYGEIGELENIPEIISELEEWVEENYGDIEVLLINVKALVNTISSYGKNNQLIDMSIYFDKLKTLCSEYDDNLEVQIHYAKGIAIVIKSYLSENDFQNAKIFLEQIKELAENYSDNIDILISFAKTIRRLIIFASQENDFTLLDSLLDDLRQIMLNNITNEEIQIEMARALSQLVIKESHTKSSERWQSLAMELKGLFIQFPNNERLISINQLVSPLFSD